MNETAKVIRFYKTGGWNVLKIDKIQLSQLKEQEVLVRVQAVAVSRPDLLWRQGYGHLGAMEYGTLLPLGACFLRAIKVRCGFRVFEFTGHPRLGLQAKSEAMERAKKFIFDGLSSKVFWAKIARVFDGLDEYAAAHRYLETNDQIGKITVALSN